LYHFVVREIYLRLACWWHERLILPGQRRSATAVRLTLDRFGPSSTKSTPTRDRVYDVGTGLAVAVVVVGAAYRLTGVLVAEQPGQPDDDASAIRAHQPWRCR
jgi:hypothetical protein